MRTRSRKWARLRPRGPLSAAALAWLLWEPSAAIAQQSGLFPLAPIRRERVPCAGEDPVYRLYRQEYFGYHPTCWRRFPAGWGCPSPEAPNAAEAFKLLPRDEPPPGFDEENPDDGQGMPGQDNPARPDGTGPVPGGRDGQPNLPPLPSGERSPFDLDTRPNTPPAGANPIPGGAAAPGNGNGAGTEGESSAAAPAELPAPTEVTAVAEEVSAAPAPVAVDDQPILALPDPTVNPTSDVADSATPDAVPALAPPALPPTTATANTTPIYSRPTQAPPRRPGLFSRLFGGRPVRR